MIMKLFQQIFWLLTELLTILRITYNASFWKNLRTNWSCWNSFISNGFVSMAKHGSDGTVVIETVFYLFGDINVHVHSALILQKDEDLISTHIKEMQKFKEQVLYFIPVIISFILNVVLVLVFGFRLIVFMMRF